MALHDNMPLSLWSGSVVTESLKTYKLVLKGGGGDESLKVIN